MAATTMFRRLAVVFACVMLWGDANAQQSLAVEADADAQALMRTAEAQLASGNTESAYVLLSGRESQLAGNAYFDYLLGVAALDSGRLSEAIFALRRSLSVESGFAGAKMELARAYYESGNKQLARPLFVALLDESPPQGVRTVIDNYIAAIDARPVRASSRFSPYVDFGLGNDTNANGSTDDPQFLGFMLNANNIETESPFIEAGLGFNWSVAKSPAFAWLANGRLSHRNNPDAEFVDATTVSLAGGFAWRNGRGFGRASIDGFQSWRDGESNQSYAGLNLQAGFSLSDNWDVKAGVQTGALDHDDAIEVLDVDRTMGSLGLVYRYSPYGSLSIEGMFGGDSESNAGSPYGNDRSGGRISLVAPLGEHAFFASLGSMDIEYDGLFFGGSRDDTQVSGLLQIEFRDVFTDGLSVIPRLRYTDNESDVPLYDYDRFEISINLRWAP